MPRTTAARPLLVVAAAVTIALAGCVPEPDPGPTPTPEPSALFGSEEEALAAAEDAYAAYQKVSDESLRNLDSARLNEVAVKAALENAEEAVENARASGQSVSGDVLVVEAWLPPDGIRSEGLETLSIHACLDLTGVTVLDFAGNAIHDPHEGLVATVAEMEWSPEWNRYLVASEDVRSDNDCG